MKYLISVLVILFFLSGCEQKKKEIEIVPDLNSIYLPKKDVDVPAKGGKDFKKKIENKLLSAVKSLNYSQSNTTVIFPINLRLYINENGSIDKIKDLYNKKMNFNFSDTLQTYSQREMLDKAIASKLTGWKFEPAKKNGKNIKYRTDITLNVIKKPDGTYKHSPLFSSDMLPVAGNDKFFIAVEQMPEPIGGIKSIQKKIKYPEEAKKEGIEGRVYILTFIDEKGNVVNTRILKGIGGGCDEAAVKAVEETKFIPGKQRGKAVKTQVSIPVVFSLK